VRFTFTIKKPQIAVNYPFGLPLKPSIEPPNLGLVEVWYNGDGSARNAGYRDEPQRRVQFRAEATDVATPARWLAGAAPLGLPRRGKTGTVTLSHPTDSSVGSAFITIPALPLLSGPYRMMDGNPQTPVTKPVGMTFRSADSAAQSLTGMSGRTLVTSLR